MKTKVIAVLLSLIVVASTVCFSACNKQPDESESSTEYHYIPSTNETTSTEEKSGELIIDTSWHKNFEVTYNVFNPDVSPTVMRMKEKKSDNAYTVEYLDDKALYYYKNNGENVDKYTIIDNEEEQLHSVYENESISNLSTFFFQSSEVEQSFPTLINVRYMYDEDVAGRTCSKYIQRAYTDGKLTATVFLWIDKEYGFAVKEEEYDADNRLIAMLEIIEFSTGNTKDEDVYIDISEYTFKEIEL